MTNRCRRLVLRFWAALLRRGLSQLGRRPQEIDLHRIDTLDAVYARRSWRRGVIRWQGPIVPAQGLGSSVSPMRGSHFWCTIQLILYTAGTVEPGRGRTLLGGSTALFARF